MGFDVGFGFRIALAKHRSGVVFGVEWLCRRLREGRQYRSVDDVRDAKHDGRAFNARPDDFFGRTARDVGEVRGDEAALKRIVIPKPPASADAGSVNENYRQGNGHAEPPRSRRTAEVCVLLRVLRASA